MTKITVSGLLVCPIIYVLGCLIRLSKTYKLVWGYDPPQGLVVLKPLYVLGVPDSTTTSNLLEITCLDLFLESTVKTYK